MQTAEANTSIDDKTDLTVEAKLEDSEQGWQQARLIDLWFGLNLVNYYTRRWCNLVFYAADAAKDALGKDP